MSSLQFQESQHDDESDHELDRASDTQKDLEARFLPNFKSEINIKDYNEPKFDQSRAVSVASVAQAPLMQHLRQASASGQTDFLARGPGGKKQQRDQKDVEDPV